MYNSTSINDGLQFINQANTRTNKTSNKFKNNKYKNNNKNGSGLVLENDIIEGFSITDIDDSGIKTKNNEETTRMNNNLQVYNASMNNLNSIQSGITTQAKIFLDINKQSDDTSLRNKDIQISQSGYYARINNAGILKVYPSGATKCGIPAIPKPTTFNTPSPLSRYAILQDNDGRAALLGDYGSAINGQDGPLMVAGPNGSYPCSDYAGTNMYVSRPIDFNYDTNMQYVGVYSQAAANTAGSSNLIIQSDLSNSTVKQCVARAMDKGNSFASLSNYNSNSQTGQCYIGNYLLNGGSSNAYSLKTRATIFSNINASHDAFTFAADGGLYSGTAGNGGNPFITPLITATGSSKVPVAILSPRYGGTISELTASFALGQTWTNWQNMVDFNNSLIGTPGGSLDTLKQYSYWYPILKTYSYQWGGNTYYYQQYDWEIRTYTSTVSWPANGQLNISYRCGKKDMQSFSRNVSLGENGFTVNCWDTYNEYPSFSLNLSDDGNITIINNKTPSEILYTNSNPISTQLDTQLIPISGTIKQMMPWAERPDWVAGSVNAGGSLTSYSMGAKTLTSGQYISSPTGKCRLIFNKTTGIVGTLTLEYSIYNVSQTLALGTSGTDKDNNLIGNSNNYSQYYLTKVDNPTVKGNVAYIDINNGLHKYPNDMLAFDNTYTEMPGFTPSSIGNSATAGTGTTEPLCKTVCNSDPKCAGYTFMNSTCKKYTEDQIYPKGDRILFDGAAADKDLNKTYIRNKKISDSNSSHYSCNKVVNNVNSSVYSSYPVTTEMSIDQKCALGLILDPHMTTLDEKSAAAVKIGGGIKTVINDIYSNQNRLKNTINTKTTEIETGLLKQDEVKRKIDKYEESNNTSTATVTDTELLLVSDNYKYVLWSIVTVLVGIGAIKTFRGASL
jgi:hypothetical protein